MEALKKTFLRPRFSIKGSVSSQCKPKENFSGTPVFQKRLRNL